MIKFANNNKIFFAIDMFSFFVNKNFNSCIIIDSNEIFYKFTRERLLIVKIENIINIITNILKLMQSNLQQSKQTITIQINKHKKFVKYNFENKIWLFNNNIIIIRSSRKFENKILKFFEIIKAIKTFYKLKLLIFIKIHFVFHINLFRSNFNNFLFNQTTNAFKFIKIVNDNK